MFISMIQKRRSIRKFSEKAIETKKMEMLVEAALRSPSSMGKNPWEFVFVTDREKLKTLSKAKPHGSSFLQNAPLGIVICADPGRSDVWVEDCSIASIILQLTAQSLGLGSCWIQIRNRKHNEKLTSETFVREVLNVPENLRMESIIAIGYAAEKREGVPSDQLIDEKIHINVYQPT